MISIIIPTLNEESVIEGTLKKLKDGLKSTPHEIIVSDGKSKDKTREIAKKYAEKVIVYEGKEKQTIGGGRNLGAKAARGEYLVFMDADVTIPTPDEFFKKALSIFDGDKNLVALTSALRVIPGNETPTDRLVFSLVNLTHYFMNNIIHTGSASGEFQMIKSSAFRSINGYRADLVVTEDNELYHRLTKIGKTRMIPSLRVYHTGRRAHKLGWPKLLWSWMINWFSVFVFKKSSSKEWTVIR